jgi:hypothetical protein
MSEVLTALNHLRVKRDMACILIAHSEIKRFDSPMSEPYDRYQPKLQSRLGSLIQEWADLVLFCVFDVATTKTDVGFDKKVTRGIGTGQRKMFTEERPAFYAKNRYGMPVELDMPLEHPFAQLAQHIPYYTMVEPSRLPNPKTATAANSKK